MRPNDVRAEIDRFALLLLGQTLALDSNRTVHRVVGGQEWVSWATADDDRVPLYREPTVEEYRRLLVERQYTVVLSDFSLIQLSFVFERDVAVKHRLCFFPCPILFDREDVEVFGSLVDYIDSLPSQEVAERTRLEAPIRLDFDRDAGKPGHPTAHLTLSRDSCRIPVFAPLSVGHFIQFVFSNFYPHWWANHQFMRDWPREWLPRTITEQERIHLHLECHQSLFTRLARAVRRSR